MDKLQQQINDLRVDVDLLKGDLQSVRSIAKVLAIRLCEASPESFERTIAVLEAMATHDQFAEDIPTGKQIMHFIDELKPLIEYGDATQVLHLLAAQGLDVGRDKLPALREWNAQATDAELAQDVAELLKKYSPRDLNALKGE